jgi:hypothetical protein
MYESASPSGPWVQSAGSVIYTQTDPTKYNGIKWKNKLYVVNGVDAPTVLQYGVINKTLKDASLLTPPGSLSVANFGVTATIGGGAIGLASYGVCAKTPIGRTTLTTFNLHLLTGGNTLNNTVIGGAGEIDGISRFFTLAWSPVPSNLGYEIFAYCGPAVSLGTRSTALAAGRNEYLKIADVSSTITTWSDTAGGFLTVNGSCVAAATSNTAYNTPKWETSGYPTNGLVVARDREERLLLYREGTVWGSALSDPLNWWTPGDAMVFAIAGDGDVEIVAGAALFDYMILFSKSQCWVYTGAGSQTMALAKSIPVGCAAQDSIVQVGTDLYLFSQFGPTSFNRIMAGADIAAAHQWADKCKTDLFNGTNLSLWNRISAFNDIPNSRVVWSMPSTGSQVNTKALVYNYAVDAFYTYDNYGFTSLFSDNYLLYGLKDGATTNYVAKLNYGNFDNGSMITAVYKTAWFDYQTWDTMKRLIKVDIIGSKENGHYTFDVAWSWDYDKSTGGPITCTDTTTDGCTIEATSPLSTEHQVFTTGIGNAIQIVFSTSAEDQQVEILGWRLDVRSKGIRRPA